MVSLVVFAKEPLPGTVKTRLAPPLDPRDAAALYTAFVEDVCATLSAAALPGDRRVLAAPGGAGAVLRGVAERHGFATAAQVGADLGARMAHAIGAELSRGAASVLLVGSDSPTLPAAALAEARRLLAPGGPAQAVLGPAADGGYWLAGARGSVPDLFDGIPWSTRDVLAATLSRARSRGIALELLPFWYDVDDAPALRLLAAHLASGKAGPAPRTVEALASLRERCPAIFRAGESPE